MTAMLDIAFANDRLDPLTSLLAAAGTNANAYTY